MQRMRGLRLIAYPSHISTACGREKDKDPGQSAKNQGHVPRTAAGWRFRAKKDNKERRWRRSIADGRLDKRTKTTQSKEITTTERRKMIWKRRNKQPNDHVRRKSKTELNWLASQVILIVWEGSCCIAYSIVTEKERTFEPREREGHWAKRERDTEPRKEWNDTVQRKKGKKERQRVFDFISSPIL